MLGSKIPLNESKRLEMLTQFEIIDSDFEESYDQIVELASKICQTPIALISLIDEKRQWFKAKVGLEVRETPRELAFCGYAVYESSSLIVQDTWLDDRFKSHPLVLGDPKIRFYAGFPIQAENGVTLGTVCAIDRVPRELSTDQLRALEILANQVESLLQLRIASLKIKKYLQELEEAALLKTKFFSLISHDLRSPFNGLLGFSSLLKEGAASMSSEAIALMANDIHSTASEAYALLNNLLEWSMLERGLIQPEYVEIELGATIRKTEILYRDLLAQKKIKFTVDPKSFLGLMKTDERMLETILRNLISNAIKFTPCEGRIDCSVIRTNQAYTIEVRDSGVGMSQEKVAKIFSSFAISSTVGTAGERGSGLGLNICHQFIERLNGKIAIESEIGKGTVFRVEIPA